MRTAIIGLVGVAVVGMALLAVFPVAGASDATTAGPPFLSSITAGFNSFNIPSGDTIWFSAVMTLTGTAPTSNLTVQFVDQKLTFSEPGGTTFVVSAPKSEVQFSTTATTATTVWSSVNSEWITTVPVNYHNGNVFLSGYSYYVGAAGIPGSTHVNWSGRFTTPECLFQLNWQWGAAVYTQFAGTQKAPNYGSVGVKPVDDNELSEYKNSDHAGTPENFKAYLAQGGTGGGGSNWTGSYSATASVTKPHCF
jgi:hypothetical protein